MNTMKKAKHAEGFDHVLLSYVEMCYAVALALTRDRNDARDLARKVLIGEWLLRERTEAAKDMKSHLLIALRKNFLEDYRQNTDSCRNDRAFAERT